MRTTSKGVHGRMCNCNYDIYYSEALGHCIAEQVQFFGLINMWALNLCPMEDSIWHNPRCLKGECLNCGVDMLITCPIEENKHLTLYMQWKCYALVMVRCGLEIPTKSYGYSIKRQ
jgi:hypothetical protein